MIEQVYAAEGDIHKRKYPVYIKNSGLRERIDRVKFTVLDCSEILILSEYTTKVW
jgi:hypothetical protein